MYPLAPVKTWIIALTLFFLLASLVYGVADRLNFEASDWRVASISTTLVVALVSLLVGKPWYYSPWRFFWRRLPQLNRWLYPDLNGIWVGKTYSNWPTIEKMFDAAQAEGGVTESALQEIPEREDGIVLEIRASLFDLKVEAYLESTKGKSYSVTARPFRCSQNEDIHLVYVYRQGVPDPDRTDESGHLGAAELVFCGHKSGKAEGVYWTRRKWKLGLNTAGKIQIDRVTSKRDINKALCEYLL